jgi:hypothetical protein
MTIVSTGQTETHLLVEGVVVEGEPLVCLQEQQVTPTGRTTRGTRLFVPMRHVSELIAALMQAEDEAPDLPQPCATVGIPRHSSVIGRKRGDGTNGVNDWKQRA